jgi:hypothetical protein
VGGLSFTAGTALVASTSVLAVRRLRLRDAVDNVLAFATVALVLVLGSLLVAGVVFGDLTRGTVLGINTTVFALALGVELLRPVRRWPRIPTRRTSTSASASRR